MALMEKDVSHPPGEQTEAFLVLKFARLQTSAHPWGDVGDYRVRVKGEPC